MKGGRENPLPCSSKALSSFQGLHLGRTGDGVHDPQSCLGRKGYGVHIAFAHQTSGEALFLRLSGVRIKMWGCFSTCTLRQPSFLTMPCLSFKALLVIQSKYFWEVFGHIYKLLAIRVTHLSITLYFDSLLGKAHVH